MSTPAFGEKRLKRAAIAGVTGLLGRSLASSLIADGWQVTGFARNRTQDLPLQRVAFTSLDIRDEQATRAHFSEFEEEGLDLLALAAGAAVAGSTEAAPADAEMDCIATHLLANLSVIRAALPALRRGRRPMILFVASLAALAPPPFYAVYSAAKAGVIAAAEALAGELSQQRIRVRVLVIGRLAGSLVGGAPYWRGDGSGWAERHLSLPSTQDWLGAFAPIAPDRVAARVLSAYTSPVAFPPLRLYPSFRIALFAHIAAIFPGFMRHVSARYAFGHLARENPDLGLVLPEDRNERASAPQ